MKLHELKPAEGSKKRRKRVGRGPGSGIGKTSGRGHNGQKSRSGYSRRIGFEGGQMPLVRRVPKRGFKNPFRVEYAVVNVGQIAELGETIDVDLLVAKGLVREGRRVKILGEGQILTRCKVVAHKLSQGARDKIEAVGGTWEEIES